MGSKKKKHKETYLFTIEEAAVYCGVSIQTVRRKIWDGRIPHSKPFNRVLVRKRDLDKYLRLG